MSYKELDKLKKSELRELLETTLQQKARLEDRNWELANELHESLSIIYDEVDLLNEDIDQRDEEIDQLNDNIERLVRERVESELRRKVMYIHESNTIFADSGELHIEADDNKTVVFNCSTLVQD